ncbi:MAG TPA: hypothetical protein VGB82_22295 [Alphaproteobacteria bacterium]
MTAGPGAPAGGPAPDGLPKTAGKPTHFVFQHKVFSVQGSYFALADDTREPTFFVPLGDMQGVLSLPQLASGFDIKADSPDAALLDVVAKGLAYVKRIQPGDSIPSELLDGTASWSVDDKHRMIAESRLRVQLASWLAGREADVHDLGELLKVANDPAIRERVQEAVAELAERLGLGRAGKAEVLDRVNRLVRELSYIEALRDRFASIKMVGMKLVQFGGAYGSERGFAQEIARVITLIRKPLGEYEGLFRQLDARTSGILEVFRTYDAQVTSIREARDDLHRRFMIWDELVVQWQNQVIEVSGPAETLIRATYRLVVRHFPQATEWQLQLGNIESRS